jgi:hypothetical protein
MFSIAYGLPTPPVVKVGLSRDRMARFKAKAIEDIVGIKRTALYGKLNQLVRNGQIKKDGNLYYVSEGE